MVVTERVDNWTPVAITLSDTADNLLINGIPYPHISNSGTAGAVNIIWTDGTTVPIYLGQGQVISGGRWARAKSTGTGAGVTLLGFK